MYASLRVSNSLPDGWMHQRYSDGHPEMMDMVAEADRVAARWVARQVEEPFAGITIYRIVDGKIVEDWGDGGQALERRPDLITRRTRNHDGCRSSEHSVGASVMTP